MSDTDTYLSCILDEGKFAIGQSLVQRKRLRPHSFVIGTEYNFTPAENGIAVRGAKVYTGTKALITGSILSKDRFRFSLTVPEKAGDFDVGNIILYVESDDGTVFPFIWVVSKIPYPKTAAKDGEIGNRFVFNLVEKIINANDILAITIEAPDFASLASYKNEYELPNTSEILFQQFYVQEPKFSPAPFIGARRAIDNTYWGMPLFSKLGDPFFGVVDSGRAGENVLLNIKIIWGGKLKMDSADLKKNLGGSTLTDSINSFIGGVPLIDNPDYTIQNLI
jgi:hypothetical protein